VRKQYDAIDCFYLLSFFFSMLYFLENAVSAKTETGRRYTVTLIKNGQMAITKG
jgi:hypothetical protein